MSLAWVAGSVRAGGLANRRLGRAGARELARCGSLESALAGLSSTPYRKAAQAASLEEAQHAVAAEVLWHLRVLGGWLPAAGGELLRSLAAWFEIANVQDRLAYFAGEPHRPPYRLGGLATAWSRLAETTGPEQLRSVLAGSIWGDPGSPEPDAVLEAMRFRWARRLMAAAPETAGWVRSAAVLRVARDGGPSRLAPLGRLAGLAAGWEGARDPGELAALLPSRLTWTLQGLESADDLWQAEARWWARVEGEAARLAAARRQGPSTVLGVAALLAADAWRVRAALAAASRGRGGAEAFDEVA